MGRAIRRGFLAFLVASVLALAACGTPYVIRHTVARGETVASLASRSGVPPEELRRLNRLDPSQEVREGDSVFLPGAPAPRASGRRPAPAEAEGPSPAALRPPETVRAAPLPPAPPAAPEPVPAPVPAQPLPPPVAAPPRAAPPAGLPALRWPVEGEVLRGFGRGPAGENRGVDLGAPVGTPIRAAAAGRVTYAGTPAQAYGPLVILDHGGEVHTVYANLRQATVKRGDAVAAGQAVGSSGEQATAPLPHVHFEVRYKGEPIDPLLCLPPR